MAKTMIRATRIHAAGKWPEAQADRIVLDYHQRHRRRMAMTTAGGLEFLLDLAQAVPLKDGDGLVLEDGRIIAVDAAPEPLAEITAATPAELLRVAWHLGNRHLPTQLLRDRLRIRADAVIEDMVDHLGASVAHITAPFDPEAGAYVHGHRDHKDDHDHDDAAAALEHDDRPDG
jgi:urease accessory protein